MKKLLSGFIAILMLLSIVPSTQLFAAAAEDEYIILSDSEVTLYEGSGHQLSAEVNPAQDVYWSSSDEGIATVTDDGYITAISEGAATITVTNLDGSLSAFMEVIVVPEEMPRFIDISIISFTLEVGMEYQIFAEVYPLETESQDVVWSSNDETVATISEDGTVTAISEGTAILTATTPEGDLSASTEVIVEPASEYDTSPGSSAYVVTIAPTKATITVGGAAALTASCSPVETGFYEWKSDSTAIATVTRENSTVQYKAVVTGKAVGTTTIRAISSGAVGTCVVTVTTSPVTFNKNGGTGGTDSIGLTYGSSTALVYQSIPHGLHF